MDIILSLMVLAALALVAGAIMLWRRSGERTKPALMVVLAAVLIANAALLAVPNQRGLSPADAEVDE